MDADGGVEGGKTIEQVEMVVQSGTILEGKPYPMNTVWRLFANQAVAFNLL